VIVRLRDQARQQGVCFAETYWGDARGRRYWVRFADGNERAYGVSQISRPTQ